MQDEGEGTVGTGLEGGQLLGGVGLGYEGGVVAFWGEGAGA